MTIEDRKEIIKATFYNFDKDFIMETYEISEEELNKIVEEGKEYLSELEGRDYA